MLFMNYFVHVSAKIKLELSSSKNSKMADDHETTLPSTAPLNLRQPPAYSWMRPRPEKLQQFYISSTPVHTYVQCNRTGFHIYTYLVIVYEAPFACPHDEQYNRPRKGRGDPSRAWVECLRATRRTAQARRAHNGRQGHLERHSSSIYT